MDKPKTALLKPIFTSEDDLWNDPEYIKMMEEENEAITLYEAGLTAF
jgi:hypothetical protein